jgi:DNA polymerase III alpha subunit
VIHWLTIADTIRGFPRHLSQHPGGFVIGRDKLNRLVPTENARDGEAIDGDWGVCAGTRQSLGTGNSGQGA